MKWAQVVNPFSFNKIEQNGRGNLNKAIYFFVSRPSIHLFIVEKHTQNNRKKIKLLLSSISSSSAILLLSVKTQRKKK